MTYLEEVQRGMDLLASDPKTIFVGQAMEFKGHAVSRQVDKYPKEQLFEFPVAEEMQMGFCIGLAIEGYIPVSIYPRCNFAILACNQIVNHLDKWEDLTGQKLKVIVKMVVGADKPLDPDVQHKANYAKAFINMCDNIAVYELTKADGIYNVYSWIASNPESAIIIEHGNLY